MSNPSTGKKQKQSTSSGSGGVSSTTTPSTSGGISASGGGGPSASDVPPPVAQTKPKKPLERHLSAMSPPGLDSELCKTFIIRKEGHTLGNSLRSIITHYPDVEFCGYSLPHPAEDVMHFRIQSIGTPAVQILTRGFEDLCKVCDEVEKQFTVAMSNMDIPIEIDPTVPSPTSTTTFLKPKSTV